MLEMMEYREQRSFIPEKRDEIVPRPVDREWAEIESIPTWPPFPRGKKRGGRLETLRFPDARRNRRKGLSVGNSVPGLRFLRPGEGGAAVSGRDGEAVGEPAFSPWPESKSSGKLYLPEDEKTVRKIPCFKGRVLPPGRAVHDSLVAHIPAAAQGRIQGNQRAGMLVIIL